MSSASEVELTQHWLALTHEAIWIFGLVGARFTTLTEAAAEEVAVHERARDRLSDRVRQLGGKPVATKATYDTTEPSGPAEGQVLVRDVESRIAATCVRLVAASTDAARDAAVRGLRTAALTALQWGGSPEPFPGLD